MIEVKNLTKSFGDLQVLQGITETIAEREVVCVIGPSGSGKSTFLRCLNLLEEPTGGEVFLDGQKVNSPEVNIDEIRTKLGMVFQSFNLFPHMTVMDNIMLAPVQVKKMTREAAEKKAKELLKTVGLEDKADSYPSSLSGGQQQRVAIARALVTRPSLFLADEPTGNLDSRTGEEIMRLFHELHDQGNTIVLITHDENVALQAERRIAIFDGHVREVAE